jgi:hypothetical protein
LSKEFPYIVVLANNIRKPAHYISWLLVVITLLSGTYFSITHLSLAAIPILVLLIMMIISLIISLRRLSEEGYPKFFRTIIFAALCWISLPGGFYIGLLLFVAALLERQSHIPVEVGLDTEGITINHFPVKFYNWQLIERCLVKDGILTIDYKNNKLYQRHIASDINAEDEAELNNFCSINIRQASDVSSEPGN